MNISDYDWMGEPTTTTEALPPFGGGPVSSAFARVVERFCLEKADLMARLAQTGDSLWAPAPLAGVDGGDSTEGGHGDGQG